MIANSTDPTTLFMHDKFYFGLFDGLSDSELGWLLSDEDVLNSVYIYKHASRTVVRADFGVPWPVLFYLGRRHKKHRFSGRRLPELSDFVSCGAQALDKLRWRNFFKDVESKPMCRKLQYRRRTKPFTARSPDPVAVNSLCEKLHTCILDALHSGIGHARRSRTPHSNILPIDIAAQLWLCESRWIPVPCDKEAGFALCDRDDLIQIHGSLLASSWYVPFGSNCIQQTWKAVCPRYTWLARRVAEVDNRTSFSLLTASLQGGAERLQSYMFNTCKTHKDDGAIAFRPVHTSAGHSFLGLMSWVSLVVSDALGRYSHLLSSSDDFLTKISQVEVDADDVFFHADLRDFFMTGTCEFLVREVSLIIPFKFRAVFRDVLRFLLDNQFVGSRQFAKQLWRVVLGSGMGLRSSSDVSNAAFLHKVELTGLALLSSATRQRFAIKAYYRYFDNLFFICAPDFDRIRSLKRCLASSIAPYEGLLEEASAVGITFLDVNIIKDDVWCRTRRVSFCPYMKPTCLSSVLSVNSAHCNSTHVAWMKAFLKRLRDHSSSLCWYRTMREHMLTRLLKGGIPSVVVDDLRRSSNYTFKVDVPLSFLPVISRRKPQQSFWIKLPYHAAWRKHVDKALRQFSSDPGNLCSIVQVLGSCTNSIRAAWMLRTQSLATLVNGQ